jgi:methionyl-tRNA formyltransferase
MNCPFLFATRPAARYNAGMIHIVFMGTPEFAVPSLRALIERHQVVGVVTQPDRPAGRGRRLQPPAVKIVAEAAGIPVYQPQSLRSEEAVAPLREWQPDLIVVAAYGQILRRHLLQLPAYGCLNVHASLLPRWRGAAPIQHALLAGDLETGVSLMRMDAGMDTGPVYVQERLPITPEDTAATLHDRLALLGGELLDSSLDAILAGRLVPTPQDDSQATYAPLIKKEDGRLHWHDSAEQLARRVRAMTPWPGAFTTWQGKSVKILGANVVGAAGLPDGRPGEVVGSTETAVVLTGEGGLRVEVVQLQGKRPVSIAEFLRGRPDFVGSRLAADA